MIASGQSDARCTRRSHQPLVQKKNDPHENRHRPHLRPHLRSGARDNRADPKAGRLGHNLRDTPRGVLHRRRDRRRESGGGQTDEIKQVKPHLKTMGLFS